MVSAKHLARLSITVASIVNLIASHRNLRVAASSNNLNIDFDPLNLVVSIPMPLKRFLLIDDHAMFRAGLAVLLRMSITHLEVLEAGSLDEALHGPATAPDLVLLDILLHGLFFSRVNLTGIKKCIFCIFIAKFSIFKERLYIWESLIFLPK